MSPMTDDMRQELLAEAIYLSARGPWAPSPMELRPEVWALWMQLAECAAELRRLTEEDESE